MLLDCMSVSDNCSYFFYISSSFQLTEKKNTKFKYWKSNVGRKERVCCCCECMLVGFTSNNVVTAYHY